MILYNGASGSLGRYMGPALKRQALAGHALSARLEDRGGLREELASLTVRSDPVLVLMAARVSVPACEADPEGARHINVTCAEDTAREFVSWAREQSLEPRIVFVSTGHVYAGQAPGVAVSETARTDPRSVYARTKLQAEGALRLLAEDVDCDLAIARVFGLIAPVQPANYLLPGLIRRVRAGELSGIPGLSNVRDYLDARDVCDDLVLLASAPPDGSGPHATVNVCSGVGVAIRDVLAMVVRLSHPEDVPTLMAKASEAPGRPDDVPWIVGDPSAFIGLTGRQPQEIQLEDTVRDALVSP